jgi:uncharacterized protein (TIGR01777 family)
MKIVVSGSSGTIGSALIPELSSQGHAVTRLVRSKPEKEGAAIGWDPIGGTIDTAGLEGHDGVVHLAGENIAGRWTAAKKAAIRNSRVRGTRLLAEALASLQQPPTVLVCASALGYYGDRGDLVLREDTGSGTGFLAEVCREWEAAAQPAADKGIRVVHLRIGVVLSLKGGALKEMLTPFKLGVGGRMGSGQQYWSWVAVDDVAGAILHALTTETLSGAVNTASPNPVTNREFTKAMGRVLGRPTIFPMPAFAAKLALGEMAEQLLLASQRLDMGKLLASGYQFRYPELEGALRHLLGK